MNNRGLGRGDAEPSAQEPVAFFFSPPAKTAAKRVKQAQQRDITRYLPPHQQQEPDVPEEPSHNEAADIDETTEISPQYISELLSLYSYDATPFDFHSQSGQQHILKVISRILLDHKAHQQQKEEAAAHEAAVHRQTSHYLSTIQRLKIEAEDLNARLFKAEDSLRRVEVEKKKQVSKLKSQLAEMQKRNIELKSRDKQYKNDIRKREMEFDRVQTRLRDLVSSKNKRGSKPISSRNVIVPTPSARKALRVAPNSGSQEIETLRDSIHTLNLQISRLKEENEMLEDTTRSLHARLVNTLKSVDEDIEDEFDERRIGLPIEMIKQELDEALEGYAFKINDLVASAGKKDFDLDEDQSHEIDNLQRQLEEQRRVIQEQEMVLQGALLRTPAPGQAREPVPLANSNRLNFETPKSDTQKAIHAFMSPTPMRPRNPRVQASCENIAPDSPN